jgi:hypothetical protein
MAVYVIVLVLLGIMISLDGIKAYHIYQTSAVHNKGLLLIVHYILLIVLVYLVMTSAVDIYRDVLEAMSI